MKWETAEPSGIYPPGTYLLRDHYGYAVGMVVPAGDLFRGFVGLRQVCVLNISDDAKAVVENHLRQERKPLCPTP